MKIQKKNEIRIYNRSFLSLQSLYILGIVVKNKDIRAMDLFEKIGIKAYYGYLNHRFKLIYLGLINEKIVGIKGKDYKQMYFATEKGVKLYSLLEKDIRKEIEEE